MGEPQGEGNTALLGLTVGEELLLVFKGEALGHRVSMPGRESTHSEGRPGFYLINYGGHELWVWLLVGQKLSNDFVHDVLGWEEVI